MYWLPENIDTYWKVLKKLLVVFAYIFWLKIVTYLHKKFYRSNATQLSESDIKEIRELRGKILNASKKMAEKFHIGAQRVYEI